jgi:hypothetical protein
MVSRHIPEPRYFIEKVKDFDVLRCVIAGVSALFQRFYELLAFNNDANIPDWNDTPDGLIHLWRTLMPSPIVALVLKQMETDEFPPKDWNSFIRAFYASFNKIEVASMSGKCYFELIPETPSPQAEPIEPKPVEKSKKDMSASVRSKEPSDPDLLAGVKLQAPQEHMDALPLNALSELVDTETFSVSIAPLLSPERIEVGELQTTHKTMDPIPQHVLSEFCAPDIPSVSNEPSVSHEIREVKVRDQRKVFPKESVERQFESKSHPPVQHRIDIAVAKLPGTNELTDSTSSDQPKYNPSSTTVLTSWFKDNYQTFAVAQSIVAEKSAIMFCSAINFNVMLENFTWKRSISYHVFDPGI